MFAAINQLLVKIDDLVWGLPLIVLILVTGIYLTVRLNLLQVFHLPRALKFMVSNEDDGVGEVSSFGALCTAMAATIGTGNIVGVATAICAGGPGALFWMWIAAFFGMATKYAECLLAVKYRDLSPDGHVLGGPFYYIEKGMGKNWSWLAKLFAFFGIMAGLLGIGTFTQVNGITSAAKSFFDAEGKYTVALFGAEYSLAVIIVGFLVTLFTALVVLGGLKRISNVAQIVVPFMAAIYIIFGVALLIFNLDKIPAAFAVIIKGAFSPQAVTGGAVGSITIAMQKGIARGIFSNESGLGSAPIAAAAAQTKEPVRQGLVSMTGTFIDTLVICTITGLCIVITGSWTSGLEGVDVTSLAFQSGLPFDPRVSSFVLMLCLVFFAFTTILGWDYYSERCLEYFTGGNKKAVLIYRYLYIIAVFAGPYMAVSAVWTIADIFNGLMAFPNLIALVALAGVVSSETKAYFANNK